MRPAASVFFVDLLTNKINIMEKRMSYVAPEVEVIEVQIEAGFAVSGEPKYPAWGGEEEL